MFWFVCLEPRRRKTEFVCQLNTILKNEIYNLIQNLIYAVVNCSNSYNVLLTPKQN